MPEPHWPLRTAGLKTLRGSAKNTFLSVTLMPIGMQSFNIYPVECSCSCIENSSQYVLGTGLCSMRIFHLQGRGGNLNSSSRPLNPPTTFRKVIWMIFLVVGAFCTIYTQRNHHRRISDHHDGSYAIKTRPYRGATRDGRTVFYKCIAVMNRSVGDDSNLVCSWNCDDKVDDSNVLIKANLVVVDVRDVQESQQRGSKPVLVLSFDRRRYN